MKIPRPVVTFSSQVSLLSLLHSALGLDHYLDISLQPGPREFWLPNIHTLHTWARVCLARQMPPTSTSTSTFTFTLRLLNTVPTADWHCPHVLTAKCERLQTGCCWANINHTIGSHRQRGRWRTQEKPPAIGSKDCRGHLYKDTSPETAVNPQMVCRQSSICFTVGWRPHGCPHVPKRLFGYGNKTSSGPCIYSCSDWHSEYQWICENWWKQDLCDAIMRIDLVKTCELIFLHVLLCGYMAAFEYWSKRVCGVHVWELTGSALMHSPV